MKWVRFGVVIQYFSKSLMSLAVTFLCMNLRRTTQPAFNPCTQHTGIHQVGREGIFCNVCLLVTFAYNGQSSLKSLYGFWIR